MKICFISDEYDHEFYTQMGGYGALIKDLSESLVSMGHQVSIFGFGTHNLHTIYNGVNINVYVYKANSLVKILDFFSIKTSFFYIHIAKIHLFFKQKMINKFIIGRNIDIVEYIDFGGAALYSNIGISVIRCHFTNTILNKYFEFSKDEKLQQLEKCTFGKNQNIISVSNSTRIMVNKEFKVNSKLIYNGVNLILFPFNDNYFIDSIGFIGRIKPTKGFDTFTMTCGKILKINKTLKINIAGFNENNYLEECRLKYNIEQKTIIFFGYLQRKDIALKFNTVGIILFPSKGEHFSMALLEAMAMGKIVICANIASFQEVIVHGFNGFLAKTEGEFTEIYEKIITGEFNLSEIKKNARRTIEERFSIQDCAKESIKFYNDVLTKSKS